MDKRLSVQEIVRAFRSGDRRALARAITIVENSSEGRERLLDCAYVAGHGDYLILGITGAGGAGKSTLIDKVIQVYRSAGKTVGVLAVDPSSPHTGGAVLGDRIRMASHSMDSGVFIRSFASRGAYGGISQGAKDALYLYKAFGFDVIIVESLGVGQAETDISCFVDVTAVVLAPGNGDSIQLAKAGTQEIADIFVINKADRPEAETLFRQMCAVLSAVPEPRRPKIIKTSAANDEGIEALTQLFERVWGANRSMQGIKEKLRIENEIQTGAVRIFSEELSRHTSVLTGRVIAGKITPFAAASDLGSRLRIVPEKNQEEK